MTLRYYLAVSLVLISLTAGCRASDRTTLSLPVDVCSQPGRQVPDGEIPTPRDLYTDALCAKRLIMEQAPRGVVTIFGSARATEDMDSYRYTRRFAYLWTKELGDKYPILTGGGPGIMEAGNRGAMEAGGKSLSFATYFGKGSEKPNRYVTDGYMFASFSQREAEMVDRAAAIVVAPGGVGTEWEIFETLAKIQTGKKNKCPVLLLGRPAVWEPLFARLRYLAGIKTISPQDIGILQVAESPEKAVTLIKKGLDITGKRASGREQ